MTRRDGIAVAPIVREEHGEAHLRQAMGEDFVIAGMFLGSMDDLHQTHGIVGLDDGKGQGQAVDGGFIHAGHDAVFVIVKGQAMNGARCLCR